MKEKIKNSIQQFNQLPLLEATINLLGILGYESPKKEDYQLEDYISDFENHETANIDKAKVLTDWKTANFVFQITKDEILKQHDLFTDVKKVNNVLVDSYFVVAIELKKNNYTRTELADVSRQINKLHNIPTLIFFKYDNNLTISVTYRRDNKKDADKEVLGKVTLIKDIDLTDPKRSHLEILFDLSFNELKKNFNISNWVQLHDAWQKTLDTKELNNRFYNEVADWYFWAIKKAKFPLDSYKIRNDFKDKPEEKWQEEANKISVIRLLTRLIFAWFIKEKNLIPEDIFNYNILKDKILNFKDNEQTIYYKAILQNLFFATLNTPMPKSDDKENNSQIRTFIDTDSKSQRTQKHDVANFFRYKRYFKNSDLAKQLFRTVPFLNGGLFECLDERNVEIINENNKKVKKDIFIDAFTNPIENEKILNFPDILFFNEKPIGDKTKDFNSGIINILNHYKFTVEENTPLEEEVALDPELLGRIFESLLAEYNPETQSTARKATGSFYTPREIVNYMVEQSLIAYFVQFAQKELNEFDKIDFENKVTQLLKSGNTENPFKDNEKYTELLVRAIIYMKILDPACGSGAFPMGILNKTVSILKIIDNDNKHWRKYNENKIENEYYQKIKEIELNKKVIENITIEDLKEKTKKDLQSRQKQLEDAFNETRNERDYARKLYIIENSLFGVDIQPIAIQISKLRFFLSLVIEQKVDDKKENRGILQLPNLETKLVAANTLIGIQRPNQFEIRQPIIEFLEDDIKNIRKQYFNIKSKKEKEALQKEDDDKRKELADTIKKQFEIHANALRAEINKDEENIKLYKKHLEKEKDEKKKQKIEKTIRDFEISINKKKTAINEGNIVEEIANKIAKWSPYDQNKSSDWFDIEWMFGITNNSLSENPEIILLNQQIEAVNKQIKAINTNLKIIKIEQIIKLQLKAANSQVEVIKNEIILIKSNIENIYGKIENKIDNIVGEPQNIEYQINSLNKKINEINIQIIEISNQIKSIKEKDNAGFDIVIGNPPYVNVEKIDKSIKENINQYKTAFQKYDLYVLFYEKSIDLLKNNGILSFITSNKFLSQGYGLLLRQLFLENTVQQIINFNFDIFESATVRTCIFQLSKNKTKNNTIKIIEIQSINDINKFNNLEYNYLNQDIFNNTDENNFRINLNNKKISLLKKIEINALHVEDICSVNYGLRPSSEKLNLKKDAFIFETNTEKKYKKYFEGKDMGYWLIENKSFINYRPDVMYNPMFVELFENEKLVGIRTLSDIGKLRFIYDNEGFYCNDSVCVLTLWHKFEKVDYVTIKRLITQEKIITSKRFSLKYLQSILNSKLIKFYVNELLYDGTHFYPNHMKQLPIKNISLSEQTPFIRIVDYILFLKKQELKTPEERLLPAYFEQIIDVMVYELYFEELLKQHNHDILKYLTDLPDILEIKDDKKKFEQIKEQFSRFYDLKNPVRNRLSYIKNIEEIGIIEGVK